MMKKANANKLQIIGVVLLKRKPGMGQSLNPIIIILLFCLTPSPIHSIDLLEVFLHLYKLKDQAAQDKTQKTSETTTLTHVSVPT